MHTVGQQIGTYFPDIYTDEDSEDEDEIEIDDEVDESAFEPYSGDDERFTKINEAYDATMTMTRGVALLSGDIARVNIIKFYLSKSCCQNKMFIYYKNVRRSCHRYPHRDLP